jgi:hypothetical protein
MPTIWICIQLIFAYHSGIYLTALLSLVLDQAQTNQSSNNFLSHQALNPRRS